MHNPKPNFDGGYNPNPSFRHGYNPNLSFRRGYNPNPNFDRGYNPSYNLPSYNPSYNLPNSALARAILWNEVLPNLGLDPVRESAHNLIYK